MMENKKNKTISEAIILLILLLITVFFFIESIKLFLTDRSIASTGGFPLIISIVMLLADGFMFFEYFRKDKPAGPAGLKDVCAELFPVPVLYMLIAMVVYVTVLPILGMAVSTFLFLAYSMYFMGSFRFYKIGLISAGTIAVIYVLFKLIFRVNLP